MKTLFLLLAIVVLASAKLQHTKATKLCTFCESFVNGIELGLEAEEKDLEGLANRLCDILCQKDKALDAICRGLIDNELDSIIKWLITNENPDTICHQLHFC